MTAQQKLDELGITLPVPPAAVAAYVPWLRTGNQIVTSGQLPWLGNQLAFTGKLGSDLTVEQGYQAARLCAINAIAQLNAATGDLERIHQIVRLEGNVQAAPGFQDHPQVLNGASDLMNEVFGDRGRHTRTALGINEMPLNAPVQLSVYAEITGSSGDMDSTTQSALAHCTLATRDVQQTSRFFQNTLGWEPIERPGNIECEAAWLRIAPGQELHLLLVPDFEPSPFEREFGRHVALTFPVAQFQRLKSRLVDHGAELIEPERETSFERFFFRDPNGYVFEVVDTTAVSP